MRSFGKKEGRTDTAGTGGRSRLESRKTLAGRTAGITSVALFSSIAEAVTTNRNNLSLKKGQKTDFSRDFFFVGEIIFKKNRTRTNAANACGGLGFESPVAKTVGTFRSRIALLSYITDFVAAIGSRKS